MTTLSNNKLVQDATDQFRRGFGSEPDFAVFAPGRVNLIGEHTDYNEGFVLPFALPYRTVIVGSKSSNKTTTIYSSFTDSTVSFEINSALSKGEPEWANYVKGVCFQYLPDLDKDFGFNAVLISSVPVGSGLSSSASLEVAVATLIENIAGGLPTVSGVTKALRCQKAEHDFADMPCGIMDQYVSALGAEGQLLLIDCRTQTFEAVPFESRNTSKADPVMVIINSNVKHKLTGSEYPTRVKQCKQAVSVLQRTYASVNSLRDATMEMLKAVADNMSTTVYNRAEHVIEENNRTVAAVAALKTGDFKTVGVLMTQSHVSLRNLYEVSCEELDYLVDLALQCPGVYGSRMTGGGFGGCTVTLVERDQVATLKKFVSREYKENTDRDCICYEVSPSAGAGTLSVPRKVGMTARSSSSSSSGSSIISSSHTNSNFASPGAGRSGGDRSSDILSILRSGSKDNSTISSADINNPDPRRGSSNSESHAVSAFKQEKLLEKQTNLSSVSAVQPILDCAIIDTDSLIAAQHKATSSSWSLWNWIVPVAVLGTAVACGAHAYEENNPGYFDELQSKAQSIANTVQSMAESVKKQVLDH